MPFDTVLSGFEQADLPLVGSDWIGVSRDGQVTKKVQLSDLLAWTGSVQAATETARDETLTALALWYTQYLGAFAADPTLDNEGNPLVEGALYWNTGTKTLRVYDGENWLDPVTQAQAEASTATTQAGIATTQAGIATTQAGLADDAKTDAEAAEAEATTQAGIATTQAGVATTQAGLAGDAKTDAEAAEAEATTQAGIATTQAGIATTQAGLADDAKTDAEAAEAEATTQAGIATTQAGVATTQAGLAGASATSAENYANTAARVSYFWAYDDATADADPGAETFRFNNATPASITQLFINPAPVGGGDQSAWIGEWDDSDNPGHRGYLFFIDSTNTANWLTLKIVNDNAAGSGYAKINVAYVAHNGTLVDTRHFAVLFQRTGNKGTDGEGAGNVVSPGTTVVAGHAVVWNGTGGTNVQTAGFAPQPADDELTALAELTSAANRLPYFTGSGTADLAVFTSFARAMLANTDAAEFKADLSLDNVDNTADADKPVSTATQAALDLKADLASPALTGDPTAPTQSAGDSSTKLATTAYVHSVIAALDVMAYQDAIDASTNPNYPAADAGHTYRISVAGKIGGGAGPNVEVGDMLICNTDSSSAGDHATVGANWNILQTNLDGAVIGPSSAVDGRFALFDGGSGGLIKQSASAPGALAFLDTVAGAQIDNDAVGLAKLAHGTHGGIIYFGASGAPSELGVGTDGQVLTAHGAAADPTWEDPSGDLPAELEAIAALTPSNDDIIQRKSGNWVNRTLAQVRTDLQGNGATTAHVGFRGIPRNGQNVDYTIQASDDGKMMSFFGSVDRTYTFPTSGIEEGFSVSISNWGTATITIDSTDDIYLMDGTGLVGSLELAPMNACVVYREATSKWMVTGSGLSEP